MKSFLKYLLSIALVGSSLPANAQFIEGKSAREISIETNLFKDGDAEAYKSGISVYKDAVQATPEDGTLGSPTVTMAASTSSPLDGKKSFIFTKDAVNRQGEGFSYDFTIPVALKGKVVRLNFDYVPSANYADDDVSFWVYYIDGASSKLIQPTPYLLKKHTLENEPYFLEFQTEGAAASTRTYRIIGHVTSTSALAYTVKFDNFKLGKQQKPYGPSDVYLGALTTTGSFTTNATYSAKYWKKGDRLVANVTIDFAGATNATGLTINLPSGYSIDTTKMSTTGTWKQVIGVSSMTDTGTRTYVGSVVYDTATTVRPSQSESGNIGLIDNTTPFTYGAGDSISVDYEVPILGWSSSQLLSSDANTRKNAVIARCTTGQVLTANTTNVTFDSVTEDSYGSMSAGVFTAKKSATLWVSSVLYDGPTDVRADVYKNGTAYAYGARATAANSVQMSHVTSLVNVVAGDTISIRSAIGTTLVPNSGANYIFIAEVQGPSQIAASEHVSAEASSSAGQSITTAGNTFVAGTVTDNTHGFYNASTGEFTCGKAMRVRATAHISTTSTAWSAGHGVSIRMYKNGSLYKIIGSTSIDAAITTPVDVQGEGSVRCISGDVLKLVIFTSVNTTLGTNTVNNWLEFVEEH